MALSKVIISIFLFAGAQRGSPSNTPTRSWHEGINIAQVWFLTDVEKLSLGSRIY